SAAVKDTSNSQPAVPWPLSTMTRPNPPAGAAYVEDEKSCAPSGLKKSMVKSNSVRLGLLPGSLMLKISAHLASAAVKPAAVNSAAVRVVLGLVARPDRTSAAPLQETDPNAAVGKAGGCCWTASTTRMLPNPVPFSSTAVLVKVMTSARVGREI